MLYALIVVLLLAVALAGLLVMTRTSAAEFRAQADAREETLIGERDELRQTVATLEREVTTARNDQAEVEKRAERQAEQHAARTAALEGDLAAASETEAALQQRVDGQSAEIKALVADNNALHDRAAAADEARRAAEAAATEAAARYSGVPVEAIGAAGGVPADTLWTLELARSERTWRTSVAVDPTVAEGPFATTDDPARLAVEVEAAALRENVGAFVAIDWRLPPVDDPARRHLVVRVAQELLEAAARNPQPLRLVAEEVDGGAEEADGETPSDKPSGRSKKGGGRSGTKKATKKASADADGPRIQLRLEPADDNAEADVGTLSVDRLDGLDTELVDLRSEDGLVVTVKGDS